MDNAKNPASLLMLFNLKENDHIMWCSCSSYCSLQSMNVLCFHVWAQLLRYCCSLCNVHIKYVQTLCSLLAVVTILQKLLLVLFVCFRIFVQRVVIVRRHFFVVTCSSNFIGCVLSPLLVNKNWYKIIEYELYNKNVSLQSRIRTFVHKNMQMNFWKTCKSK